MPCSSRNVKLSRPGFFKCSTSVTWTPVPPAGQPKNPDVTAPSPSFLLRPNPGLCHSSSEDTLGFFFFNLVSCKEIVIGASQSTGVDRCMHLSFSIIMYSFHSQEDASKPLSLPGDLAWALEKTIDDVSAFPPWLLHG